MARSRLSNTGQITDLAEATAEMGKKYQSNKKLQLSIPKQAPDRLANLCGVKGIGHGLYTYKGCPFLS